jgi:hypothetical protein
MAIAYYKGVGVRLGLCALLATVTACNAPASGGIDSPAVPSIGVVANPYTIRAEHELIGGPQAEGRVGDILMSNGVIRAVIQQPGKYAGISSFGGAPIDIDWVRREAVGQDQFGYTWPLVNVEWTLNGREVMAFAEFTLDDFLAGRLQPLDARLADAQAPVIVVRGAIDVYDYLDLDLIQSVAVAQTGQEVSFDPRFDDLFAPFEAFDLRHIQVETITSYRMPKGQPVMEMTTTFFNTGDADVKMPIGDFVNGSGELQLLIPGLGFSPPLKEQILGDTPAIIYVGQDEVPISYGYFYRFDDFVTADAPSDDPKRRLSGSLSYSGVTGILLGEEFTKVLPVGKGQQARVNTVIPAQGRRSYTRYLVVGDGSAGTVLDAGLRALDIPRRAISGWVVDQAGNALRDATVAVLSETGKTIVTYDVDGAGRFSGYLSDGSTQFAQAFGSGIYELRVERRGHHFGGSDRAGTCTPAQIDVRKRDAGNIVCMVGRGGLVEFSGPMVDADSKQPIPVRLTVVGVDASPDRARPGVFTDTQVNAGPYGIVQFHYLNASGGVDLSERTFLALEPGNYLFVYSRGPEYALRVQHVGVRSYGSTTLTPGTIRRVMPTPHFISGDFHVHAKGSPDSGVPLAQRTLAASGEGLDVLHSSDHDYHTDYAPIITDLADRAWIPQGRLASVIGAEITPNNMGHIHAFPLSRVEGDPSGGALDWSAHPHDRADPSPDYQMSVQEILDAVRDRHGSDTVLQMNHISDIALSLLNIPGTVTGPWFRDSEGIEPLSVFTDPMQIRFPATIMDGPPFAWGTTPFTSRDFTAVEVTIGPELNNNYLWETGLPQWFNLLNLGLLWTAVGDSDSHTVHRPIGMPRNFIYSTLDPADGKGADFSTFDEDAYARAINDHRVVVSAGPFIQFRAQTDDGQFADMGEMVRAKSATLHITVSAPHWAWFDTIEIYANTQPEPVDDDGVSVGQGVASSAATFFMPYHRPQFTYRPVARYSLRDATLPSWKESDGLITATITRDMKFSNDTWVVVVARGTQKTDGFRSLFPVVTYDLAAPGVQPPLEGDMALEEFYADEQLAIPAWAFTNPIFFDTDGDSNGDGKIFEALWLKQGLSPVGKGQ